MQRAFGLRRGTVALEPHHSEWEIIAQQTITRLHEILQDTAADIQHIGSTAIRGIFAKPIIDIVIGVSDFDALLAKNAVLAENGFLFRGADLPEQYLYVCGGEDFRTHHIHVVIYRSEAWENYISLRDYLNSHPDDAKAYSDLKQSLAARYPADRETYTAMKSDLIHEILCRAGEWRSRRMKALIINCSPVRTGATAEIVRIVSAQLSGSMETETVCIDDYDFAFCKGCRSCYQTAQCVQDDDIPRIMDAFERADIIVCVSPSYWADIPGQFKAFIDRCTPWCNTHTPHRKLSGGKRGYAIALRTGPNLPECARVIGSIEHFYGHLEISCCGHLGLTGVEYKEDVAGHAAEIIGLCREIVQSQEETAACQ